MFQTLESRRFFAAGAATDSVLIVGSLDTDNVLRYDADTGAFIDEFVRRRSGGVNQPWAVVIGPHDGDLYVTSGHFQGPGQIKAVLRFDGQTGAFIDEFVSRGQMDMPHAVTFGPDGNGDGKLDLYVGDRREDGTGGRIERFDAVTGALLGDFVPLGSGGLDHPLAHVFGPDANGDGAQDLYVTDEHSFSIRYYDGVTGAFLGDFVSAGSGGLAVPFPLVFGPDGNLYVGDLASLTSGPVLRYQGPGGATPGAFMDVFIPPGRGDMRVPLSVLFGPDRNGDGHQDLYVGGAALAPSFLVAKQHTSSVKVFDGVTGAYLDDFIDIGSGGLRNPGLMTFTETDPVTLAYRGPTTHATTTAMAMVSRPPKRVIDWGDDAKEHVDSLLS